MMTSMWNPYLRKNRFIRIGLFLPIPMPNGNIAFADGDKLSGAMRRSEKQSSSTDQVFMEDTRPK